MQDFFQDMFLSQYLHEDAIALQIRYFCNLQQDTCKYKNNIINIIS